MPVLLHGLPGPVPELCKKLNPSSAAGWLTHNMFQFQRYMVVHPNYTLQTEKSRYQRLNLQPPRHYLEGVWVGESKRCFAFVVFGVFKILNVPDGLP